MSTAKVQTRDADRWALALLRALVREERTGRRPPRLTESKLATWERFKRRTGPSDLAALMFEDAAVLYPVPFDADALGRPELHRLTDVGAQQALDEALGPEPEDYLAAQARTLGLPSRMARSELHVVKPHQRVLELPGTGGQLAHHLVTSQDDLNLETNFVVGTASWAEMTLAGIIGLDLRVADSAFIQDASSLHQPDHPLRAERFDFVVGLHPDKGGLYQQEDQLSIWFPAAKVLLV